MININKLKGKIVENGYTMRSFAREIGMSESTLSRRLSKGMCSISIGEATRMAKILHLKSDDVHSIFFADFVA